MLDMIVCVGCGCPIGDKAPLFRHLRAKKMREQLSAADVDPLFFSISGVSVDCADIFESLEVHNDCCRMHMTTIVPFSEST